MAEIRTVADPRTQPGLLPIGTECFYRLRMNGELVPARVIDAWTDDMGEARKLRRPKSGRVHLEVALDMERHFSAAERGLRLDVPEGTDAGYFMRERPENEDAVWAKTLERREIESAINRERARVKPGED